MGVTGAVKAMDDTGSNQGRDPANVAGSQRLRLTCNGGVAVLELHAPGRRNALDLAAWKALTGLPDTLRKREVRAMVVHGAPGAFCAGADIAEFDTVRGDPISARAYEAVNEAAFAALRDLPFPTVAAIDGACFGGGFGIAAACDLRIASPASWFAVPAARLGLAYPVDAMERIVAALGEQAAKALLFTADAEDADRMREVGFLWQLADDPFDQAMALANRMAAAAPLSLRAAKLAMAAVRGGDRKAAVEAGDATFDSRDYAEGRRAFREKRRANFEGR